MLVLVALLGTLVGAIWALPPDPTLAASVDGTNSRLEQSAPDLGLQEIVFLYAINRERRRHGLEPFTLHPGLSTVARARSADMARYGYFAHYGPTGSSASSLVWQASLQFDLVAETLARSGGRSFDSAFASVRNLMASRPHRAVILNPSLTMIGVGAARDASYLSIFTAVYAR